MIEVFLRPRTALQHRGPLCLWNTVDHNPKRFARGVILRGADGVDRKRRSHQMTVHGARGRGGELPKPLSVFLAKVFQLGCAGVGGPEPATAL